MKIIYGDFVISNLKEKELNTLELPFKRKDKMGKHSVYKDCIIDKTEISKYRNIIKNAEDFQGKELDVDLYTIYCDGGSFNNIKKEGLPTFGSYGTIIFKNDKEIVRLSGCTDSFTNNQGEVTAFLNGLKYISENVDDKNIYIRVISDSQYVVKGSNEWIYGWIKRGWKNNENKDLPNLAFWKEIYDNYLSNERYKISFSWVKGHSGQKDQHSLMNEQCDILCNEAINKHITDNYPELFNKSRKIKK